MEEALGSLMRMNLVCIQDGRDQESGAESPSDIDEPKSSRMRTALGTRSTRRTPGHKRGMAYGVFNGLYGFALRCLPPAQRFSC